MILANYDENVTAREFSVFFITLKFKGQKALSRLNEAKGTIL